MRLKVDNESDTLYLRLDDSMIMESEEVSPGVIVDFNANGIAVGIEILNLSTRIDKEKIKQFQYEVV